MSKPELGEIRKATDIGYKGSSKKYIYAACSICGKARWVQLLHHKPERSICIYCSLKMLREKTKCLFCYKNVKGTGVKVAIYSSYGRGQEGIAHKECLKKYHQDIEFGNSPRQYR